MGIFIFEPQIFQFLKSDKTYEKNFNSISKKLNAFKHAGFCTVWILLEIKKLLKIQISNFEKKNSYYWRVGIYRI